MTGKWNGFAALWGEELQQVFLHIGCGLHYSSLAFERSFRAIGGERPQGPVSFMWGTETGMHIENVLVSMYVTFAKDGKWEVTRARLVAAGVESPEKFLRIILTRWGTVYKATDVLLAQLNGIMLLSSRLRHHGGICCSAQG